MNDSQEDDVAVAVATPQTLAHLRTHKSIRLDIYKKFAEHLKIKFHNDDEQINDNEDDEFDRVFFLGLEKWETEITGYEIIHNGKPADKRVLKKMGRIAFELLQFNSYPKINASCLIAVFNKSLGVVDKRILANYRKTILYYCNIDEQIIDRCKDPRLGELNVSGFVRRVPSLYIQGGFS